MFLKLKLFITVLSCAAVTAQDCPDDGLTELQAKCSSCSHYIYCTAGVVAHYACGPSTACVNYSDDTVVCLSVEVVPCGSCTDDQFATCDPYDPQIVEVCIPGEAPVFYQSCDAGEICQDGACVGGTTTGPGSGGTPDEVCEAQVADPSIVAYPPECTSGLLCVGGTVVNTINCTDGQYFDPATAKCESLPVNNCGGGAEGLFPSRTDCTMFVACEEGEQVFEGACGEGEVFDTSSNSCVSEEVGVCGADLAGCVFEDGGSY